MSSPVLVTKLSYYGIRSIAPYEGPVDPETGSKVWLYTDRDVTVNWAGLPCAVDDLPSDLETNLSDYVLVATWYKTNAYQPYELISWKVVHKDSLPVPNLFEVTYHTIESVSVSTFDTLSPVLVWVYAYCKIDDMQTTGVSFPKAALPVNIKSNSAEYLIKTVWVRKPPGSDSLEGVHSIVPLSEISSA